MPGDIETASRSASIGYTVFRSIRRCAGDSSTLATILTNAFGDLAPEEVLVEAAQAVISSYGKPKYLARKMRDFGQFAAQFGDELAAREGAESAAEVMKGAGEVHAEFVKCDADASGTVSREEFASFAVGMEMPHDEALVLFEALDTDANGELSFQEWLELEDPRSVYSRLVKAARPARSGYKIFQAARQWTGDSSALSEVLTMGLGQYVKLGELASAVESVISSYDAHDESGLSAKSQDFGKFAGRLAEELMRRDREGAALLIADGQSTYEKFVECDADGNGTISKQEFIAFAGDLGMSIDESLLLFTGVDADGNGAISFDEWIEFMESPSGRDHHSFNCAGQHGLKPYSVLVDIGCDWCGAVIASGSTAFGCRLCDCDACADCAALHTDKEE